MIIKNVNLETVCGVTSTLPDNSLPEVAFAGKSNVGKSSLINTLLNRKGLARTSSQPGKTQTINFYNVNEKMYLVDLPGYGYATANEEIKAQWGVMIENYLHSSKQLTAVFLLIDIRHEPSENDCLMYEWMVKQGFAPIIIATKLDKISKGKADAQVRLIQRTLSDYIREMENVPPIAPGAITVIPFSAESKEGRDKIWETMETLAFGAPLKEETRAERENRVDREKREKEAALAAAGVEKKKERWKKTGKPVAKKTAKMAKKKAAKKK